MGAGEVGWHQDFPFFPHTNYDLLACMFLLDDATPEINAAPDKLERVLLNLLTNALRHTPSDGSVAVIVEPADESVHVAVEDTGTGLAPGGEHRIFERFWRAASAIWFSWLISAGQSISGSLLAGAAGAGAGW